MPQVFTSKENIGTLSKTSNTIITLTPSRVTIGGLQYINLANVTINTGTTGIGGLDTGSIQANKVYNVFAVPNSGFLGIIASLNSSPTGYSNFTKIGSFSTNGSSEVTSVWTGDKTLWQKKVMTTANTPSQMNFNGLGVGKSYKLSGQIECSDSSQTNANTEVWFLADNGGQNIIHAMNYLSSSSGPISSTIFGVNTDVFIASATTITCSKGGHNSMSGGGRSFLVLEELINHEITTQWT